MNPETLYICPKEKSCKRKHACGHDFPHRALLECGYDPRSPCPACIEFKEIVWVYQEQSVDDD